MAKKKKVKRKCVDLRSYDELGALGLVNKGYRRHTPLWTANETHVQAYRVLALATGLIPSELIVIFNHAIVVNQMSRAIFQKQICKYAYL